jgi:hypothetical protein
MPIKYWKQGVNRFMIEFEEQLAPHVQSGQFHSLFADSINPQVALADRICGYLLVDLSFIRA